MENSSHPKSSSLSPEALILASTIILALVFVLGPPLWQLLMRSAASIEASTPVGTVQRIRFIGNMGIDTQIDTEERSFMVIGVSKLQKGMPLRLHRDTWNSGLCNADASICEQVMGVD